MSDISNSELRRLNMTVLLMFLALLRHRNATRVAAEMGLTQSGVSQGLKRLRAVFGDPLFLRQPHGLEPTAVALALAPAVTAAVDALRGALTDQARFDPATAMGTIRLAAYDMEQAILLPKTLQQMCHAAPDLCLSVQTLGRTDALAALGAGSIDIAVGYFWDIPDHLIATPLYTQGYAVVGRPTLIGRPATVTMQDYLAATHLLVSPKGDLHGVVDDILARDGLHRRIKASVPQFFPALAVLADADCIATLPDSLAHRFGPLFGLACCAPPLTIRSVTIRALRHRRDARNHALDWFTALLVAAA
jgi:DNA-binding transcriptional LysR family regulator